MAMGTPIRAGAPAEHRPVDLVHLSRQTFGERGLEREVLALFQAHAALQLTRIRSAADAGERRAAAHHIKGSARSIGAWPVARLAGAVEEAGEDAGELVRELAEALAEACAFIDRLAGD
jgi:HPt (histidine-containing phosphotransfer) domain-containing protein